MCNSFNNPRLKLACSSHGGSPIPYLSEENFLLARKEFSHAFSSLLAETDGGLYVQSGVGKTNFDASRHWQMEGRRKLSFPSSCVFETSLVITSSRIYGGKFIHIHVLKLPFSSVPCVSNSPLLSLNFQYGLSLRGEGEAKGVNIQLPGLPGSPTSVGGSVGGFRFLASSSFPCFAVGGREGEKAIKVWRRKEGPDFGERGKRLALTAESEIALSQRPSGWAVWLEDIVGKKCFDQLGFSPTFEKIKCFLFFFQDKGEAVIQNVQNSYRERCATVSAAGQISASAMYPVAGAVLGTCLGGPVGLLAGVKLGGIAALGGSVFGGYTQCILILTIFWHYCVCLNCLCGSRILLFFSKKTMRITEQNFAFHSI